MSPGCWWIIRDRPSPTTKPVAVLYSITSFRRETGTAKPRNIRSARIVIMSC
jgi:hypothetical protein